MVIFVENLPSPHNNNNKVVVFASLVREISSNPGQEYVIVVMLMLRQRPPEQIHTECTWGESIQHPALFSLPEWKLSKSK